MRRFSKILLGATLLGVILGVSYLLAVLDDKRLDRAVEEALIEGTITEEATAELNSGSFAEGATEGASENPNSAQQSLVQAKKTEDAESLENTSVGSAESEKAELEKTVTESASALVSDIKPQVLAALKSSGTEEPVKESTDSEVVAEPKPRETEAERQKKQQQEIVSYFQSKLNDLPDDLTSYEKKVAIKEIRDEVCDVFKITPARLTQLARKNNLTGH